MTTHIPPAPIQARLNFGVPLITVVRPPHNPALVSKLKPATLHALALLSPGRAVSRLELQAIAGNRYCSRINELRAAGYRVLGPRRWKDPEGEWVSDLEPLRTDRMEMYRMVRRDR